jgi:hypothetical protein
MIGALAAMSLCWLRLHHWIPLDAAIYGRARGCTRCGDLQSLPPIDGRLRSSTA